VHHEGVDEQPISAAAFNRVMSHGLGWIDLDTREALQLLGTVLRELRQERRLSQRALAGRCGLSQSTISRLECGLADGVRVAWIARLLAGLDAEVRIQPDDRPVAKRCHGFRRLRNAFSAQSVELRRRPRRLARQEALARLLEEVQARQRAASRADPGRLISPQASHGR
jgi:transcriptional regulator with XRE-family HTH domain